MEETFIRVGLCDRPPLYVDPGSLQGAIENVIDGQNVHDVKMSSADHSTLYLTVLGLAFIKACQSPALVEASRGPRSPDAS